MTSLVALVKPRALSHSAHLHAFKRLSLRKVDVEAHALRQTLAEHLAYDVAYVGSERGEVGVSSEVAERESDGRHILHAALDNYAHRAAIVYVHRRVVAVIDAAYDHVGHAVLEELDECHLHAVHRCAVAGIHLQPLFLASLSQA